MRLYLPQLEGLFRATRPKLAPRGPATRLAAVAVVLRSLEAPEVLLMKRAANRQDPWSGHIAFPGGRHGAGDRDCLATAIRETQEELGIDLARSAHHLGPLDDVQALWQSLAIDMVIVPHVFVLAHEVLIRPNPAEVERVLWTPIEPMWNGQTAATHFYRHEGQELRLPAWQVDDQLVWGLTHRMLDSLFDVLRAPE